jgi:peptidoglycan/xylan/chitin deacetylase (PgdA/CDA1 family)
VSVLVKCDDSEVTHSLMRGRMRRWVHPDRVTTLLARSPGPTLCLRQTRRLLRVLAYHGVDDPSRFAAHLRLLRDCPHLTPVSLQEVEGAWRDQRPLPDGATLITFDDGERSVLEHGLPLLQQHGLPAVVFVVAGLVGSNRPYWWEEVHELAQRGGRVSGAPCGPIDALLRHLKAVSDRTRRKVLDELRRTAGGPPVRRAQLGWADLHILERGGVRVENHSLTHPCLDRCDDATVEEELDRSHRLLADALGREPTAFAYPNGNWDARIPPRLARRGYRLGFRFDHRLADRSTTDPFMVSRLRIDSSASLDRFRLIVSGLHPALHHARGRP